MQMGFMGLGRMGANMVRRLLQGGHECVKVQQELLRHAHVSTTLNVYTQGAAAQKREALGKVVRMVLPNINTKEQPKLLLLPLLPSEVWQPGCAQ